MKKRLLLISLIVALILAMTACGTSTQTDVTTPDVEELPQAILEISNGDQVVDLTFEKIKELPAVEGYAGIMSSTGKITAPTMFKGVALTTLLELVDGIDESKSLEVTAVDGYSMTMSMDQVVNGSFITYDAGTGDEIEPLAPMTAILAYEMDGNLLDEVQDGNLRMVMVSESNLQVVDGHWSIKWVNRLKVKEAFVDWELELVGAINETMQRADFESGAGERCHGFTYVDNKNQTWTGIPLWLLVGRVDDEDVHSDGAYNDDLADAGYDIDVVAIDGYTVTFNSKDITRDDGIIVAYLVNGNPLNTEDFPLRLVGENLTGKQQVGAIASIVLRLGESTAAEVSTEAEVDEGAEEVEMVSYEVPADKEVKVTGLVESELTLTSEDLAEMEAESVAIEHPKQGWIGIIGIPLEKIFDLVTVKSDAKVVVLVASDGYQVELPLADVLECEDCYLGWDEELIRTYMPGFESSAFVKDLVEIQFK